MNIIYDKITGEIKNFLGTDSKLNGLKGNLAQQEFPYEGDKTETNISELDGFDKYILDSMTVLSKLELSRALKALSLWKEEVKPLIKSNEDFEDDWNNATDIDLTDEVFLQGFAMTSIDMDTVKRKILELRG